MSNARNEGVTDSDDGGSEDRTRRGVLAGALGIAAFGAAGGYFAGGAAAQSSPSGTVGTASNPYLRAYVDRVAFVYTSDPSSPADGTLWYNSSA